MDFNSYRTDFKTCCKCNETKAASEFSGKTATYCRPCFGAYRKALRQKHKENPEWLTREKPQSKENKAERRAYYVEYLRTHPCAHCGEADPIVLEFNHIDPSQKTSLVSKLCNQGSMETLKAEIEKCEVLCANCHKRVTARQMNWFWLGVSDKPALNQTTGNSLNPYRRESSLTKKEK
jgi:hypothetical protein